MSSTASLKTYPKFSEACGPHEQSKFGSDFGLFWPGCALVLLLCWTQAILYHDHAFHAEAVAYGSFALSLLLCAAACLPFVRSVQGHLRVRWTLFLAAILTAGFCYTLVFIQHMTWMPAWFGQPNTVALTDISEALYLLSATLLFSGASRTIAGVDATQALLFAMQRFLLTWVTNSSTHFSANHLLISQSVALFLCLAATLASLGASSRGERRFLRLLALFLGLRFAGMFCADQVSYTWLHHLRGSVWDIPHCLLMGGFALFLLQEFRQPRAILQNSLPFHGTSMTTRNLMPSLLAIVNISLGFCIFRRSALLAGLFVIATLTLYIVRTVLLQSQMDRDSARLQSRNRQLETLAARDALTGAGNRRSLQAFYERLQQTHPGGGCTLLLVDIDHFKQTNDRFGHVAGDALLAAVAGVLRRVESTVPGSHGARFGGDEFALLLPSIHVTEGLRLGQEICRLVAATRLRNSGQAVSVSIGAAIAQDTATTTLEDLMSRADRALYGAKLSGRNRAEMDSDQQSSAISATDVFELKQAG